MKTLIVVIGIQCSGLFLCMEARAEGGCPPGSIPFQFAPNQPPGCMPNGGQVQPQRSLPEIWSDRYGAIARDPSLRILGTSNDLKSERAAREAALDDCKAKGGGQQCRIYQTYRNGCGSFVISSSNGFYTPAAATPERAEELGMEACTSGGDTNCRVAYTACSFPERIQ